MTIELIDVTKKVRLGPIRLTYKDLNIRVEQMARMAFLAHKSAGVEAIINLICAADAPDKGIVRRSHSISWAIPNIGFLHKHIPLIAGARFIARLYEVDEKEFIAKVSQMARLDDAFTHRVSMCNKEDLSRFGFAAGVCLPFDQYLFTTLGGKDEREERTQIINGLCERSGILLLTSDTKAAQQFCDQAYVFDQGQATYFDDMEAAIEFFKGVENDEGDIDSFFDSDPELEDLVNVDF